MINKKALEGYGRGAVESEVNFASPHRIIQMLMEGALSKIATAKGCIDRNDIAEKSRQITWGMNIIQGLRTSLDAQKGGEVAANLDALYEYMGRRLLEANVSNDVAILDEVSSLLMEVKAGWDNIPADYH
ncbi:MULTISPECIES: flagellar export chaperone FliS [unclassified Methylophaga]|uniref:flagellar export chaperone FliS n=1 Tax=unclassified Methylophaga TaxID=2629249 RepID=UPI000C35C58B|nr:MULTISPECIES: flagellar export chaperone FliS [unclassified Methylophaga]MAL50665.1 flagellar protein FliS [Methylophaga sp.]MAP26612.1 flagellar protein FliS [Methylophaga sp.]MBP24040.1 flagellar protein FliS [Methylophaga sp.]MDX1749575.1 flagellar export chaperone FliS [Methylophaga sp.]HBX59062.1 flagellar protein FliS [Methylophaga sp.]